MSSEMTKEEKYEYWQMVIDNYESQGVNANIEMYKDSKIKMQKSSSFYGGISYKELIKS